MLIVASTNSEKILKHVRFFWIRKRKVGNDDNVIGLDTEQEYRGEMGLRNWVSPINLGYKKKCASQNRWSILNKFCERQKGNTFWTKNLPYLWHIDIIIGQPLVSSQLSHFLNWQCPRILENAPWGRDKLLKLYLGDENSGQWEWGQRKMKQGVKDDHCFTRCKPILVVSTCLQGGLQTGSTGIAHLRRGDGKEKGARMCRWTPYHLLFFIGRTHSWES